METRALDGYGKPVTMTTLDNGTTVISFEQKKLQVTSFLLTFATGSMHDTIPGDAHYLEHMVMEGPSRGGIHPVLLDFESRGMTGLVAETGRNFTRYGATTYVEHAPELLTRLFQIVTRPEFGNTEVENERPIIISEYRQNRFHEFFLETERLLIPECRTWNHRGTGDEESIARIQPEGLKARHADTYTAANLLVLAYGKVNHAELVEEVERLSCELPRGSVRTVTRCWNKVDNGRYEYKRPFFNSTQLSLVFDGTHVEDLITRIRFSFFVDLLFGPTRGSLFKELRVNRKLAYMTSGTTCPLPLSTFEVTLRGIDPARADEAESCICDILQGHADNGFDATAIEYARTDQLLKKLAKPSKPSFGELEEDWLYGNLGKNPDGVAAIRSLHDDGLRDIVRAIYDPKRYTRFLLLPE
ncbi:insulinase family protein [Candidatus Uhrbacteria bacterium]|nr:MAG: insulinase family protein [Candidatus Uhrbacteria bacterium]